jgi:two-component system LytT family sensor kinase
LRAAFGDEYGVVVETAPGAGTRVTLRVPKFAPGVTASRPHEGDAHGAAG